jgi:hypothetical protein
MGEVIQFPGPRLLRDIPRPRRQQRKWRPMTDEECFLALSFVNIPALDRSPFAQAMIRKAQAKIREEAGELISDRMGRAIFDVARDKGLIDDGPASPAGVGA